MVKQLGKSTDTIEVSISGVTADITVSGLNDTTEETMTLTLAAGFTAATTAQGDIHLCQIRVNDTLATEFTLQVQ